MPDYKNILIVRTDRIGDVVLTTPSIRALRLAYPQAHLAVMVTPQTRDLVEGNPDLSEVLVYDRKGQDGGLGGFWRFVFGLRRRKFDLAVIFHTKKRTNLICFLAGIPHRLGYKNDKFGFLLTKPVIDKRPEGKKHEAEYCLDLLKHVGVQSGDLKLSVPLKKESERWAEEFLKTNNIIGACEIIAIHPDASCISKRWPIGKFIELIKSLLKRGNARIILIGGTEAEPITRNIQSALSGPVIDVAGKISLSQLASLLKRCRLLISNDSGPVHVAAAVGTPVVSIFGRNQAGLSPARWRPLGPRDVVIHKEVGCEICLAHNCNIHFECLEAVSPKDVLDAAAPLLA